MPVQAFLIVEMQNPLMKILSPKLLTNLAPIVEDNFRLNVVASVDTSVAINILIVAIQSQLALEYPALLKIVKEN